ncbi:hypothetical protein KC19_1G065700 [Ceratodon purpureus]|uniref:Uncharacterized protein n=1 Tax=Ceratodon purpureus TaxID=3225 RepID=A0A8T0J5G6_CERPU|nr:hypothetical protein KC19_1G065700 [Ceratodon purpureus]
MGVIPCTGWHILVLTCVVCREEVHYLVMPCRGCVWCLFWLRGSTGASCSSSFALLGVCRMFDIGARQGYSLLSAALISWLNQTATSNSSNQVCLSTCKNSLRQSVKVDVQ